MASTRRKLQSIVAMIGQTAVNSRNAKAGSTSMQNRVINRARAENHRLLRPTAACVMLEIAIGTRGPSGRPRPARLARRARAGERQPDYWLSAAICDLQKAIASSSDICPVQ